MTSHEPFECHWRGQRENVKRAVRSAPYLTAMRRQLTAQGARDDSDAELDRCLGHRPCGRYLVQTARYLRDEGFTLVARSEQEEE